MHRAPLLQWKGKGVNSSCCHSSEAKAALSLLKAEEEDKVLRRFLLLLWHSCNKCIPHLLVFFCCDLIRLGVGHLELEEGREYSVNEPQNVSRKEPFVRIQAMNQSSWEREQKANNGDDRHDGCLSTRLKIKNNQVKAILRCSRKRPIGSKEW